MINFHFANIIICFVADGALKSPAGNLGVAMATPSHYITENGKKLFTYTPGNFLCYAGTGQKCI